MSYRFVRVFVLFDLPMETNEEKREYRRFRKLLLQDGFVMMQKSVYTRMALNQSVENSIKEKIRKGKPKEGVVQIMTITEKQFSKMEFLSGESESEVIDTDERMIIL